jgi:V-type H+-transporting ATPase 16kDa proteolipid subunit
VGAAFGTAKSGIGIAGLGTFKPELVMKVRIHGHEDAYAEAAQSLIPVVMSGIIAVYGLVVSVLISGSSTYVRPDLLALLTRFTCSVTPTNYSLFSGFVHLGAGLACGLTGMAAGYALGLVGDSVSRCPSFMLRLVTRIDFIY